MIDSFFEVIAGELGVDFIAKGQKLRGILGVNEVLIDAFGSDVIANETTLLTDFSNPLRVGDEIIIGEDSFKIKTKTKDYRMKTIKYGLEKIEN